MGCASSKKPSATSGPTAAAATNEPEKGTSGGNIVSNAVQGIVSAVESAAAKLDQYAEELNEETRDGMENAVDNAVEKVGNALGLKQGTLNLGEVIPNFEADTTFGKIKLHDYFGNGWGILFSHPADFTPVCTTELGLVEKYLPEFAKRNCKVIALSCDPVDSHLKWATDVVAFSGNTDEKQLKYPIIADEKREIATKMGMLDAVSRDAAGLPNTARAVFVVGPEKTLKLSILYPATTGRNFNELIRILDSLQLTAQRKLATPADWQAGQECIVSTAVSQEDAVKMFPSGVRVVDLPSKKPYLRFTAFPEDTVSSPPAASAPPAQTTPQQSGLNLGDSFPNFEAESTQGKLKFWDFLGSSWGILFSHPADFTPVCTTELAAVAKLDQEFKNRDVKVACISCDPVDSHMAWTQDVLAYGSMTETSKNLPFPIIADPKREIAVKLGMLDAVSKDAAGLPNTCRAVFVIGPDRKLKLSILYPATTGRNFREVLRAIDSLQLTASRRLATPGNWIPGQDCVVASSVSTAEAFQLFPQGVKIVDLPSGKQYLRFTPDPRSVEEQQTGKKPKLSAEDWAQSDEQLQKDDAFKLLHKQYTKLSSQESLDRAVAALEAEKHTVKVFDTSSEALEYLKTLITDNASVSNSTSTTLEQIGFIAYLKAQDARINNLKGKAAKAAAEGNMALQNDYIGQGAGADIFFSGVAAVAETGEVIAGDLSGTRVSGWLAAKKVVLVSGTNKIVKDVAEAKRRLHEYQCKVESARSRVVYGVPGSAVLNEVQLNAANPFGSRTTIVLIKESLGF